MLLMSSTKDSLIIWVSENKKATGVLRLSSTWDGGKDHGQREKWTKATAGKRDAEGSAGNRPKGKGGSQNGVC